eukprot:363137-Chlamydomonas_euryale.AAC.10
MAPNAAASHCCRRPGAHRPAVSHTHPPHFACPMLLRLGVAGICNVDLQQLWQDGEFRGGDAGGWPQVITPCGVRHAAQNADGPLQHIAVRRLACRAARSFAQRSHAEGLLERHADGRLQD